MKWRHLLLFALLSSGVFAQDVDSLSLLDCFKLARANSPYIEQLENNQQITSLKSESISTSNLPQLSAYGKAWYQSDAVAIPPMAPGAEGFALDRFQYNFGAEVNQKIFDGGLSNKLINIEEMAFDINNATVETTIYQLYQKIADNYFAILLFQENQQILALKSEYLGERQKSLESAFKNGTILKADIDKLKAEQLVVHQQNLELVYSIQYLKKNLILLLGIEMDEDQLQIEKSFFIADLNYSKRPEYLTLSAQEQQLLASKELFSNSLTPKLSAYGQLGYSYPGLNFFENQSDPYYIVGVKFGWNIYDWKKTSKEKEILDVQILNLKVKEADIDRNFESGELAKLSEINKLTELIKTDQQIIDLKTSIVKSSSSAFDNGTISSSDYLQDLNAEIISRIELNKHTIQLNKNQLELALIKGINIE